MGLPVRDGAPSLQLVHATHHLVDGAEAQLGHDFPQLLRHHEEVVDDVLGLPSEFLTQVGVLGGDANGAGIEVALAQHDAAHDDEGGRGHTELLRPQQAGDCNIAACLHLAIGLHDDAPAQVVLHQHLLGLSQPQLPRQSSVLDGGLRRCAGASAVAADQHHVTVALGDTSSDGAHAHFRHQLHMYAGIGIGILQIVYQLSQVFDGIDVVVWRR